MTFELVPLDHDVGHFVDRRIGLSARIPGRPVLAPRPPSANEPTYEVLIQLGDIPVTLRYRQNEFPPPTDPVKTIPVLVQTFAANRCRPEHVKTAMPAQEPQRRRWGVEAAASLVYPLRDPDVDGDMEEVLIQYRDGRTVTWTRRFARDRTSWISWALCTSAFAAGLRWDPAGLASPPPPLWPRSSFLLPGIKGVLATARLGTAQQIATTLRSQTADSVNRLAERVALLLQGSEPPDHVITPEERQVYEMQLADAGENATTTAILAALGEVENAHDLRGFAILCLHALGKHVAQFGAEGDEPLSYLAD